MKKYFGLAAMTAVFAIGLLAASNANAASTIVVRAGEQPQATLAPQSTIVPFTRFTIEYPGESYSLDSVSVARGGLFSNEAFYEVLLIAKKSPGFTGVGWMQKELLRKGK